MTNRYWIGDREVTVNEWRLGHEPNSYTLRAACKGEGLPVSGTNAQRGRRLHEAGLLFDDVVERYGWRARQNDGS